LQSINDDSLKKLIASAETPADFEAAKVVAAEAIAKRKRPDPFLLLTLTEVADFFGVGEHTVRTWRLRKPQMPGEPGKWPIKQIVQWRCDWIQQTDLASAKRKQDFDIGEIERRRKQIDLDREEGLILDRQDVELWAATALIELREGNLSLTEILTAAAPPELKDFVRAETDRHVRDLLTALVRRLELAEIGKGATDG